MSSNIFSIWLNLYKLRRITSSKPEMYLPEMTIGKTVRVKFLSWGRRRHHIATTCGQVRGYTGFLDAGCLVK